MSLGAIKYQLKVYIFWLVFFALTRAVFLVYLGDGTSTFGQTLLSFVYGWIMDTSMTGYLMILPLLLTIISVWAGKKIIVKVLLGYHWLLILLFSFMAVLEIPLYEAWGFKMHIKAFVHLEHPSEIFRTASWGQTIGVSLSALVLATVFGYIFMRFISRPFEQQELSKKPLQTIGLLLMLPLLVIGIRGGFQQIPLQQSDVYFSNNQLLNNAAINTPWNLIHSYIENKALLEGHPYQYMSKEEAKKQVDALNSSTPQRGWIKAKRPNIVLVILESWTADMVEAVGGAPGLTPNFSKLSDSGLLFDQFYASGERSDQGICTILSGYPAQPITSIITQPARMAGLPAINKKLQEHGYASLFVFGGQLNYGNIKSFLVQNEFDKVIEEDDFSSDLPHSKLGYPDHVTFDRFGKEVDQLQEPFIASIFTLSSHEPFDIPIATKVKWDDEYPDYAAAMKYSDQALGDFMKYASKRAWFKNTLFVFVADHGHHSHKGWNFYEPNYRKIPLLFWGEALEERFRGNKNNSIGGQADLPKTLLNGLEIDASEFTWGKDLLDTNRTQFAYYSHLQGFGMVTPKGYVVYDHKQQKSIMSNFPEGKEKQQAEQNGKAYLQHLMDDYMER